MGRSRNYRTKCPIRKPVAPPTKVMKSKKDYVRDREEVVRIIEEGLKEFEEEEENESTFLLF